MGWEGSGLVALARAAEAQRQARGSATDCAAKSGDIRIFVSTAPELLAQLYTHVHALRGDFEALPVTAADYPVPAKLLPDAHRFFGDDYSIAMNLLPVAVEREWTDATSLLHGLRALAPGEAAVELLRPASGTADARVRRTDQVRAALFSRRESRELQAAMVEEGFRAQSVADMLEDPGGTLERLIHLLDGYAAGFAPLEDAVLAHLRELANTARKLIDEHPRREALRQITGGWTLRNAESYAVTLVPTLALRHFAVIARIVEGECAVVAYGEPGATGDAGTLASAAKALANEQRLLILQHVRAAPATGQELAKLLDLTEATVHHHTSALRGVGLLVSERDSQNVYHALDQARFEALLSELARLVIGR